MHVFETVSVIGLGYIGLPTAATLASSGVQVIGVDVSKRAVDAINQARAHFSEPDLDGLVQSAVHSGKLRAVTAPEPAEAFIIAVPTPVLEDKSADMSCVERAARQLAPVLAEGNLIILESTSPVGTTAWMASIIAGLRPDLFPGGDIATSKLHFAYCPERILPGQMVYELVHNDRILGGITPVAAQMAKALYERFVRGQLIVTKAEIAELCKLIENAYRDVNIAFANEVSNICEEAGLDVFEAIAMANHHPRVNILNPGPGVGGHCIAVDPWFLISRYNEITPLMRAARNVNDHRPHRYADKIKIALASDKTRTVACLGLAYKPDVDDLRESPAIEVVELLADADAMLLVVEPNVEQLPANLAGQANVKLVSLKEALEQAGTVALLVGHRQFKDVTGGQLAGKKIVDAIGYYRHHQTV